MACSSKQPVRLFATVAIFLTLISIILAIQSDEIEYELGRELHVRKPRFVRIYSKSPGEDAEKRSDLKFHDHVKNALHGGSVGLEFDFKPLKKKFSGFVDTVQKYWPSIQEFKKKFVHHPKTFPEIPSKGKEIDIDNSVSDEDDYDDNDIDIDYKPKPGIRGPKNEEISAEWDIDPRKQEGPNRLVDMERERFQEQ